MTSNVDPAASQLALEMGAHAVRASAKSDKAFKTISEAADLLDVPQHVLRFWESKFRQIQPLKMKGGRRYYRPEDIALLQTIQELLYRQGYTIKGARKALLQARKSRNVASIPAHLPVEDELADMDLAAAAADLPQPASLTSLKRELLDLRDLLHSALEE